MSWGFIGAAAIGAVGGAVSSRNAKKGAQGAADAQAQAAQLAAEEARFRPIGVTNAFGSSNFTFDDETGRLTGAGYNVDPKLAAIRDQLLGLGSASSQNLGGVNQAFLQGQQGLLGSVANAGDIQGQTQRLFSRRQDLLAPQRERDLANLRNQSYQAGRSGLAVGGTNAGGYAASNPEMQAFFNAQRQQDDSLLAQTEQDARNYRSNDISTLASLFSGQSGSIAPILQMLQGSGGAEELGRSGFDLGTALGGRVANPSGASMLQQGLNAAAQSNMNATAMQNQMTSGLFNTGANLWQQYMNKGSTPPPPNVGNGYYSTSGTTFGGGGSGMFDMGGP